MADLTGSWQKLARAEHHLNVVREYVKRYVRSQPYSLRLYPQPHADGFKMAVLGQLTSPPARSLSFRIGEFAHNARGALDHLVYALSTLGPDDKAREKLQFPILDRLPKDNRAAEAEKIYTEGLTDPQRATIEGYQPRSREGVNGESPLGFLAQINNVDKHRTILASVAIANLRAVEMRGGELPGAATVRIEGNASISIAGFQYQIVNGGEITEQETVVAMLPMMGMHVSLDSSGDVVFGPACKRVQRRQVFGTLALIHDHVKEIIGKFN